MADEERRIVPLRVILETEIPDDVEVSEEPLSISSEVPDGGADLLCGSCGWKFGSNVPVEKLRINPPTVLRCPTCGAFIDLREYAG